MAATFRGWPASVIEFYAGLEADNSKAYWTEHKHIYDDDVRAPFDALSEVVADEFGPLHVFRPYRDVRFSKDKSPYKTRCYGVAEGEGGERYYVAVGADGLHVGSGAWMMAKDQLERYRAALDDDRSGPELERLVAEVEGRGLSIQGDALKTAPRGWPRDHPRIELLRRKSLAAMRHFEPKPWLHTAKAADRIVATWREAAGMNAWLATHVGPSQEAPPDAW